MEYSFDVRLPTDSDGYIGRECPQSTCRGYFMIKPGTGLDGEDLKTNCPYCGHTDNPIAFNTQEQQDYIHSLAFREIDKMVRRRLKKLEFSTKPKGLSIGVSVKLEPGKPIPIRYYQDQTLEEKITCANCDLYYAVYGVYAYCPDCRIHNSLQILERALSVVKKMLQMASEYDDQAIRQKLVENALENLVSAFDGFGRQTVKLRAHLSNSHAKASKIRFQDIYYAEKFIRKYFEIQDVYGLNDADKGYLNLLFNKRHLLAHNSGVIDEEFINKTKCVDASVGHRIKVSEDEVMSAILLLKRAGHSLVEQLPEV